MKRIILIGVAAALALFLLSSCAGRIGEVNKVIERNSTITLEGKPLTLLGPEVKIGQKAPNFRFVAPYDRVEKFSTSKEVELAQSQGKLRLISVVPSLDTPVCDLQTQRFEEEAKNFQQVVFYTISMDLPFAQARYCGTKDVSHMQVLSDYRDGSFGLAYGALIKELRLLSRAIFIIDQNNSIRYVEYVKKISLHPDYDTALATLQTLIGASSIQATPSPTTTQPPPTTTIAQGNQVGNLAPSFQLNNLDGKSVSLSDLRGKPILLNFWATWCPPCRLEMPYLQQIYDSWSAKGLVLLEIDIGESSAIIEKFLADNNLSLPVLLDIDKKVALTYGIAAIPTTFFIDKNGVIQEKVIGAFPSQAAIEQSLSKIIP